jgi:sugar phosphate isomerase/epimerase
MSFHTRTGNFPIGFRRLSSPWQRDLSSLLNWARDNDFEFLDLLATGDEEAAKVIHSRLRLGSVDLPDFSGMLSASSERRAEAVARNSAYIRACARVGRLNHFTIMIPEDKTLSRSENFGYMIDSYRQLAPVVEEAGAKLVIEGWPGPGVLCCTPETLRCFFHECPTYNFGINYDPSHLIRMGIDPIRFLHEFGSRVFHIHGKDTELLADELYDLGTELAPTFEKPPVFGGGHWRYTLPGHGQMRWSCAFSLLRERGYKGSVSIELGDARFNGSEEGEKEGLLLAAQFLSGC